METTDANHCDNTKLEEASNSCGISDCDNSDTCSSGDAVSLIKIVKESDSSDREVDLSSKKQDDSGIEVERSPVTEGASKNSDTAATLDRASNITDKSQTNYPSTLNESEGIVADLVDTDDNEAIIYKQLDTSKSDQDAAAMSGTDSEADAMERGAMADLTRNKRATSAPKRRRSRSRSPDSSNQSDAEESSSDDSDAESKDAKSDAEDNYMEGDVTTVPHDPWKPVKEVFHREMGYRSTLPMPLLFRMKAGSSVNLVQRLELQNKLEQHNGCVNALHFNDSGSCFHRQ